MKSSPQEIFDSCLTLQSDSGQAIEKPGELPTSAGLILFADNQDSPILLLSAANIRRTAKNKLAEKVDPSTSLPSTMLGTGRAGKSKKADLKSITTRIYYKTCPCKFRLALEHYKAVKKIFASNYKDHITFIYPWFIEIDLNEKIPFFSITRKPSFKNGEKILGPFSSQKSAAVFLNTLEDAFKLCKRSDLASNPQRAAGCPYLQMDACSGVCGGKIRPEEYQNIIKDAFEAGAEPAKQIEKLQADMQRAAKDLNFELAAELKKKIEKLSTLNPHTNFSGIRTCSKSSAKIGVLHQESQGQHSQTNRHSGKIGVGVYRWTGDLAKLKIVHIDKSSKIKREGSRARKQTYAVFVMNFFEVIDIGDFVMDDPNKITEAVESALLKLNSSQQETDSTELTERFSIVSYFLYRTNSSGLWVNTSEGFDPDEIAEAASHGAGTD